MSGPRWYQPTLWEIDDDDEAGGALRGVARPDMARQGRARPGEAGMAGAGPAIETGPADTTQATQENRQDAHQDHIN